MEDGGPEPRGGEPGMRGDGGDGTGLSGLLLLLLQPPGDGTARGETPEPGSSSLGSLARSLQKAEAVLRSCVTPGLRRLMPPRPRQRRDHGEGSEDEEEEEEAPAFLAPLEQSFPGLQRCLRVWEDPRTETFRGHVRHPPGDGTGAAAFSYQPVHTCVAEHGATLHALLRQRHLLRLARDYSRRLKAASDFLRRLLALPEPPAGAGASLRELCQELRVHAGHWSGLQRRMRGDPWLRPLLLRRHEAVAHMRRALALAALQAARAAERHAEGRLRALARDGADETPSPALLCDLFQGLEIYNRVLGDMDRELGGEECPLVGSSGASGAAGSGCCAFSAGRVLEILAAERGQLVAKRLQPFLWPRDVAEPIWEEATVPWPLARGAAAEEPTRLATELRALCCEDEELMGIILEVLVASADTLWHPILRRPHQEKPSSPELLAAGTDACMEAGARPSSGSWKSVRWLDASRAPAAEALHAQYRRLLWAAAGTALGHRLGLPPCGTGGAVAAAREMSQALAQAGVPRECEEELGPLCLWLLCQGVLRSWDRGFCRALGSALSDPCSGGAGPLAGPVRSRTGRCLQRLYPGLALALRCLRNLPGHPPDRPPGPPCPRLQVLSRCVATAQAGCQWLVGRACRYLAAWALPQFLLVTQGDLQLLKTETDRLVLLVSGTFPEPGDSPPGLPPNPASPRELQLCRQLRSVATSIQLFSGDVLKMFSTDCKRMSAEIFDQTMPLGKHWRVGLRPELPTSPSAYAAAAAQAVLGQVLQGAQLLPRDAQAPALARVTTAFLEAWMDHILAQRIKFSLQGALQLRQDFELVRELVASERYELAPETRQALLALRVFQQMDGAILCLLQQPGGAAPRAWHPLRRCCSDDGAHPAEPDGGTLHDLDTLEPAPSSGTPQPDPGLRLRSGVPESYLSGSQQQWLSLRLHRARRWRVPGLPCVGNNPET